MNTNIKIAMGMFAGLIAGTMLVGTAVAAPRMMNTSGFGGYGMMRSFGASGTFEPRAVADMNSFMDQYLTADGSIDINRMHSDVTSGKVTPPHMQGASGSDRAPRFVGGQTGYRGDPAMMQGLTSDRSSAGYNMMGSDY